MTQSTRNPPSYLDKDQFHVPLRTRERAAVEVARKYLRAIVQESARDDEDMGSIRALSANALIEMAKALGERS